MVNKIDGNGEIDVVSMSSMIDRNSTFQRKKIPRGIKRSPTELCLNSNDSDLRVHSRQQAHAQQH